MTRLAHPLIVVAATLAIGFSAAAPLLALGPTVLMFYGEPLKKPVLVTGADVAAFGDMLLTPTTAPAPEARRTFIMVALFWGPPNNPANNGVPVDQLTPQMAWQHGRLYPATTTQPALLLTDRFVKAVQATAPTRDSAYDCGGPLSAAAVALLQRLGIPAGPPK